MLDLNEEIKERDFIPQKQKTHSSLKQMGHSPWATTCWTQSIPSQRLEVNYLFRPRVSKNRSYSEKKKNNSNNFKLNSSLLSNQWVKQGLKRFLETNEHRDTVTRTYGYRKSGLKWKVHSHASIHLEGR